jgi:hypothetical protein
MPGRQPHRARPGWQQRSGPLSRRQGGYHRRCHRWREDTGGPAAPGWRRHPAAETAGAFHFLQEQSCAIKNNWPAWSPRRPVAPSPRRPVAPSPRRPVAPSPPIGIGGGTAYLPDLSCAIWIRQDRGRSGLLGLIAACSGRFRHGRAAAGVAGRRGSRALRVISCRPLAAGRRDNGRSRSIIRRMRAVDPGNTEPPPAINPAPRGRAGDE